MGKNLLHLRKERRVQRVAPPISGAQWPLGPIQTPRVGKPDAATSTHPATTQSDWGGRQRGIPIQMATDRREPRPGLLQFSGMQIPETSQRLPHEGQTLRQVQRSPGARWTRLPLSVRRASRPNLPQHSPWIQSRDYTSHLRRQMERRSSLNRGRPPRRAECYRGEDQSVSECRGVSRGALVTDIVPDGVALSVSSGVCGDSWSASV